MNTFGVLFFVLAFSFQSIASCVTCYSIEDAMENPTEVRQLILRNKGIQEFPEEILEMTKLTYLDLSFNNIVSFPEAEESNPALTHLLLSRNIGLNTHSLFNYTKNKEELKYLELNDCRIGQLSYLVSQHAKLKEIHLAGNLLQTVPGELGDLAKLVKLDLSRNELENIPFLLSGLFKLQYLDISQNLIEDHQGIFLSLSASNDLKHLSISLFENHSTIASNLSSLPLKSLSIIESELGSIPTVFFQLPQLKKLSFQQCYFGERIQRTMDWSQLQPLEELQFINCTSLPSMQGLSSVTTMQVFGNNNLPIDTFCKMKKIGELNLSGQPVTYNQLNTLKTCLPTTSIIHSHLKDNREVSPTRKVIKEVDAVAISMSSSDSKVIKTDKMMLEIPSNAFITADKKVYTGQVEIRLKELYDPVAIYLEQIPMTFNNNGEEEVFGSNGMFEFRAYDEEGNELQPNPEQLINVTIENQQPENPGELFYLNDSTNTWQRAQPTNILNVFNIDSLRASILDSLMQLPDSRFVDIPLVPLYMSFKPAIRTSKPTELVFLASKPPRIKNSKEKINLGKFQYASNLDQHLITQYQWKLDTLTSPDLRQFLYSIRREQRHYSKKKLKRNATYSNVPRPLKNLEVKPDFERDCFTMSFDYYDTTLVFPVYLESKESSKNIAKEQLAFYTKYLKAKTAEEKNQKKLFAQRKNSEKQYADQRRNAMAMNLAIAQSRPVTFATNVGLSFNLRGFGVVNCDYFQRNPVTESIIIPDELSDTEGRKLDSPEMVTLLMLTTNSALPYNASTVIPISDRESTLIIYESDDKKNLHVAKIKKVMSGIVELVITTIVIEGVSSKKITEEIYRAAE